jgi:hypothetical protein
MDPSFKPAFLYELRVNNTSTGAAIGSLLVACDCGEGAFLLNRIFSESTSVLRNKSQWLALLGLYCPHQPARGAVARNHFRSPPPPVLLTHWRPSAGHLGRFHKKSA